MERHPTSTAWPTRSPESSASHAIGINPLAQKVMDRRIAIRPQGVRSSSMDGVS